MLRIVLVRHAESVANTDPDLICGRSPETPLSEKGKVQCDALQAKLASLGPFEGVYASPTVRTQDTARRSLRSLRSLEINEIQLEPLLHEQCVGEWEGCSRKAKFSPDVYARMNALHIDYAHPGGESIRETGQRAKAWLDSLPANQSVIVFTHSMVIRAVLQWVLKSEEQMAWRLGCDNASVSEIVREPNGCYLLVRMNA